MNYRHAYHAGNAADVLKHVVLFALIEALQSKSKPFCYLDSHAGRGVYALDSIEAGKTVEYRDGVLRVFAADDLPPLLARWRDSLMTIPGNEDGLRVYPGSPLQVARMLRPDDRAQLCELQRQEAMALRGLFDNDARLHVHERDGYAALKALLPPVPRRGLVLIDPPYEAQQAEYAMIKQSLDAAWQRWPEGMYAVWYPIKRRADVQPFLRWASQQPVKRTLCVELLMYQDESPLRLNGSGMVVFNAPWHLDKTLAESLQVLEQLLRCDKGASARLEWLRSDAATA